jgi:hypothetical protein
MLRRTASSAVAVTLALSLAVYAGESLRLPDAAPAAVGFCAERLHRLHTRRALPGSMRQFLSAKSTRGSPPPARATKKCAT